MNEQIAGQELKKLYIYQKKKNLVIPLMRKIDNSRIIEHAAIVRALDKRNLENSKIGIEISKYLQQRLNLDFKYF